MRRPAWLTPPPRVLGAGLEPHGRRPAGAVTRAERRQAHAGVVRAKPQPRRHGGAADPPRSEVSGRRLWSWAKDTYGTPEAFFERFFVANYSPLVFMEESGRNRVPEKLPNAERLPMNVACDRALRRTVELFEPRFVIGVGKFAEKKAKAVVGDLDVVIGSVPHPSPASSLANRGWAPLMTKALEDAGVLR